MPNKLKKIRVIFLLYWILLAYILAALIWWYIALTNQNSQMTEYKIHRLKKDEAGYAQQYEEILDEEKRKKTQYIGEGVTFFLLISAGAIFVYRAVKNQLQISQQQQNFMMAITHELKTPIAVTKLNLETLQKRKLDETQQQRLLSNTLQESNRMNSLCNNLLLSSQIEAGGYRITAENLEVDPLLEDCTKDFVTRHPERSFITQLENNVQIEGDALLLRMAFNNLLENAVKYSQRDTTITISLTRKNNQAVITFADQGPGIPDEEKKKVFSKFYRLGNEATRKAKGTGLGLYIVKKIVEAHHAAIAIENCMPSGAAFVLTFKTNEAVV